jgi:hypothetical protein
VLCWARWTFSRALSASVYRTWFWKVVSCCSLLYLNGFWHLPTLSDFVCSWPFASQCSYRLGGDFHPEMEMYDVECLMRASYGVWCKVLLPLV